MSRVAIVGLGYVGLPLAINVSRVGHVVVGVDNNATLVDRLSAGKSHIGDVSDSELYGAIQKCHLRFDANFNSISDCEIVVICVPTPLDADRNPDTSYLEDAVRAVASNLQANTLLISESTSYPGTVRDLIYPIIKSVRGDISDSIDLVSAPERVDPGNQTYKHSNTPRVIGGMTPEASLRAANFYKSFTSEVISVSGPEAAEAAKLLENTFRQVNIAFVNEFAQVCRKLGVDAREVIAAASSKPYGFMPFCSQYLRCWCQ